MAVGTSTLYSPSQVNRSGGVDAQQDAGDPEIVQAEPPMEPAPVPMPEIAAPDLPLEPILEPDPEPIIDEPLPVPEPVEEPDPELEIEPEVMEGEIEIIMDNGEFTPDDITIRVGTTVVWIMKDFSDPRYILYHNVWFNNLDIRSPDLFPKQHRPFESWSYTFNEVGEFSYYCNEHPWMKASVIVVA